MKANVHVPILLILSIFLTNCQKPQNYETFKDFPITVSLSHTAIEMETPIMYPSSIDFIDSALVVLDIEGEYFLSFFSLDNFTLLNHGIRSGRGPQEEETVFGLSKSNEQNTLWYKTFEGFKKVKYTNNSNNLMPLQELPICIDFYGVTHVLNDGILGIPYLSKEKEFVRISTKDCLIEEFGPDFPEVEKKLSIEEKSNLLGNKGITIKPDGQLFAATYVHFPIIRIYNALNGNLEKDIRLHNNQSFPNAHRGKPATPSELYSTTLNYIRSYSTQNYFYVSYSGKSQMDLQPNVLQEGFKAINYSKEIHVFDWEGNPIKRIILDKMIFAFAVSPDDKTLIAIPLGEPDLILKYDLKAIG